MIAAGAGPSSFAVRAQATGNGWVDQLLDGRPSANGKPTRVSSVYCCPDIRCCARYAESDLPPTYRLYEVLPRGRVHVAPMILVNRIARRKAPDGIAEEIADEYWICRHPWRYLELLADSLEVVREVARPDSMSVLFGDACMQDDLDRAVRLRW